MPAELPVVGTSGTPRRLRNAGEGHGHVIARRVVTSGTPRRLRDEEDVIDAG